VWSSLATGDGVRYEAGVKLSPDHRLAGVLVPVFALRGTGDLGIGDTVAVKEMIDWCARHGFRLLQVLPINETGPDHSPYNAISALALDPTTIATTPATLPDLTKIDFQRITGDLSTPGPVHYPKVKALKRDLLWAAFQRAARPTAFLKAHRWLEDYTLYRALLDENHGNDNWETWPKEHQSPNVVPKSLLKQLDQRRQFYAYVQWIAYTQWHDVRRHAEERGVALMGDIPFGVSRTSADVWANRELFELTWSGGAPPEPNYRPDPFTAIWGQNWGIPLYRWAAHRKQRFAWWRQRVQQTSGIFHLFRIDHVLGFYRLYAFPWLPSENGTFEALTPQQVATQTGGRLPRFFEFPDDTVEHKTANCTHGEALLQVIQQAAGDTVVVAEDLGVVPDYVRPSLLKLGIPGFKIPHWERNPDYTYQDPSGFPRCSIATPSIHDHEPLAALWKRLWNDHDAARAAQQHHQAHVTWLELQRFHWWCGGDGQNLPREFTRQLHEAYCRRVLSSPSWLAIFTITDIFAQEHRFNIPGSFGAGNWSVRLTQPVTGLDPDKAGEFARLIRETGRCQSPL